MIDTAERPTVDVQDLPLTEWRCSGVKSDGRPCKNVLNEYACTGNLRLRKRCDKCGTWNTFQR